MHRLLRYRVLLRHKLLLSLNLNIRVSDSEQRRELGSSSAETLAANLNPRYILRVQRLSRQRRASDDRLANFRCKAISRRALLHCCTRERESVPQTCTIVVVLEASRLYVQVAADKLC